MSDFWKGVVFRAESDGAYFFSCSDSGCGRRGFVFCNERRLYIIGTSGNLEPSLLQIVSQNLVGENFLVSEFWIAVDLRRQKEGGRRGGR